MNHPTNKIISILFLLVLLAPAFAASEAEYRKLAKTYTLHADGSQEFRCNMELTLFTHTAMNGTYGESFIVYNPACQELKIHASYTKQKDGNIIKTPDNAFVEVLPRHAADAPAYNKLTEMVVVHTGLELGATIFLDYSIISKPGYLPEIDICEDLLQTSPVKEYTITIVTPEATRLSYSLQHSNVKPGNTTSDGNRQMSWTFRNLPASSRSPFVSAANGDVPCFVATTYPTESEALAHLYKQFNPATDAQLQSVAESLTEGKETDTDKLQAIYRYVMESYDNNPLTLAETGYKLRQADAVINTAYGTLAEKTNLLCGLLNAVGIQAEPAAIYHIKANQGGCGLSAIDDLLVIADADGKRYHLSPIRNTTASSGWINNLTPVKSLKSGETIEIDLPAAEITYQADLNMTGDKAETKVTTTLGTAFLPCYGNYLPRFAGSDKEATETKGKDNTTITYTTSQPLKSSSGYTVLSLPDSPVSLSHTSYCTLNSDRKENLALPFAVNEQYTYTIGIPEGAELTTPDKTKTIDNKAGKLTISVKKEGNKAEVTRNLKLYKQLYTPAEFTDLRELLTVWGDTNNKTLVFKN